MKKSTPPDYERKSSVKLMMLSGELIPAKLVTLKLLSATGRILTRFSVTLGFTKY